MGSYLSSPVKQKESENGVTADGQLDYGASAMQGWRVSQEDAHVTLPEFDEGAMLFAVFDGHGGAEVAKYAALHLSTHIKSLPKYKQGDYEGALLEAFLSFDALLREPHVLEVLKAISKSSDSEQGADDGVAVDGGSSDDDEEDLEGLLDEADAPMEDILKASNSGDMKALIRKRIDIGGILRAAMADAQDSDDSHDDSDEDEEEEEEEEEEDDEDDSQDGAKEEEGADLPEKSVVGGDAVSAAGHAATGRSQGNKVRLDHLEAEDGQSLVKSQDSAPQPVVSGSVSLKDSPPSITEKHASSADVINGKKSHDREKGKSVSAADVVTVQSVIVQSVIIDDDAAAGASLSVAGPSSGEPSSSDASSLSTGVDDVEADRDYTPTDEIDSDDDDDDEEDWEEDTEATARVKVSASRRMLMSPGMFEFGDMGHSVVSGFDSGATACLALIKDNLLYVANVGDSRCVVSQNGLAVDMSYDHKPEDPVETARINKAGGKVTSDGRVNNGLNLSRALGDHNYKRNEKLDLSEQMISAKPDIKKLQLDSSHDFMIIACDGIWNSMSSQEVVDFVRQRLPKTPPGNLSRICEEMFDAVIAPSAGGDGTGMDNCSAVIVRFSRKSPAEGNGDVRQPTVNGTHQLDLVSSNSDHTDDGAGSNSSQKRPRDQDSDTEEALSAVKKVRTDDVAAGTTGTHVNGGTTHHTLV